MPDPWNTAQTALLVMGTAADDTISIKKGRLAGSIVVTMNRTKLGVFLPTGRVIVHGLGGNDTIRSAGSVAMSLELHGGAGNDDLKGSNGNDLLLGDSGADTIAGGGGRDVLIGGLGADRLGGDAGDDLLIGSTIDFDVYDAALSAIVAEWISPRAYPVRVNNLRGTGSGPRANGSFFLTTSTVGDDAAGDTVTGHSNLDWVLARLTGSTRDRIKNRQISELLDPI
jgi:hypothetical protein